MSNNEAPSDRRKTKSKKSRKVSASESGEDERQPEDYFEAIRTARPARVNPYLRNLIIFFTLVLLFAVICRLLRRHLTSKHELAGFLKSRAEAVSGQQWLLSVYQMLLYQVSSMFVGLLDFLVQAICIVTIFTEEENARVQEAQRKIQFIISTTKREELQIPTNPSRKQILDQNSILNTIMGTKNFRVKIMKLEFLKECLTLNYVAIGTLYFVKLLIRVGQLVSEVDAFELLLESCLMSFLLYKNLVYILTRIWPRKELQSRLAFGVLFYTPYFLLKAYHLAETIFFVDNLNYSLGAVLSTALVYFIADKINASSVINNARTSLFMVLYSKK